MKYFYCVNDQEQAALIMAKNKKECISLFKGEFEEMHNEKPYVENVSFQYLLNLLTSDKDNDQHLSFG